MKCYGIHDTKGISQVGKLPDPHKEAQHQEHFHCHTQVLIPEMKLQISGQSEG